MKSILKKTSAALVATAVLAGTAFAEGPPEKDFRPVKAEARTVSVSTSGTAAPKPQDLRRLAKQKNFGPAFYEASAQRNAQEIAELTQAFIGLSPKVDKGEAARAARAVYTYVDQLVIEYEIEGRRPLAHNTKVNLGLKPRGLCWHWAHDIDARLMRERFKTLEIHRAIANHNNIRLEHSTTMLGARGAPMSEAIVLDPWRKGGELFWEQARNDRRYNWTNRDEVFAYKKALKERREGTKTSTTSVTQ